MSENIKVNDDGTISPIDPTKPSSYTTESYTIDTFLDVVLDEVAKGARLDGFHAKDLLAYPNQSDRYMKPAKASIKQFIENMEVEAYKKGYIQCGLEELRKYENDKVDEAFGLVQPPPNLVP